MEELTKEELEHIVNVFNGLQYKNGQSQVLAMGEKIVEKCANKLEKLNKEKIDNQ